MRDDKAVWDFLYKRIGNPYGVAALMGNLYVESGVNPVCLQSSYCKKFNMTSEEYTKAVDSGSYENFVNDHAGYGLVQWAYWSRKEALLNFAKDCGLSIGNLDVQLQYMWAEIQKYKTVMEAITKATSVREASDVVTKKYERPKNQSEEALKNRADFGQMFFTKFASEEELGAFVVATDNVNIRIGNNKEYVKVGVLKKDEKLPYVAQSDNGWYAVKYKKQVCWVSGEFSTLKGGVT